MADKGFGTYRKNKQGDVEYKSLKESEREAEAKDKAERESPKRKIKDAANAVAKEFMFGVAPENKTDAFKKGGRVMKKISEYGGKEMYSSKSAMKKHEKAETPMEEKMEKKMGKNMARATMQKKAMAKGGIATSLKAHAAAPASKAHAKMAKGGMACGGTKKYAKGGSIDGCATKGKTKGRMI